MSLEALIFDVDGTLADTEEMHRHAFNQSFKQAGLDWHWTQADYRVLLGTTGGKERLTRHIKTLPLKENERDKLLQRVPELHALKTEIYSNAVNQGEVPLRPGVARLLDEAVLSGLRLAIATTTTAINVDALLQASLGSKGRESFDVIACGDQVAAKKPAPDIYELALFHLGIPAANAIAFEDSPNGLKSARAAGLTTIVTPTYWTSGYDFSAAKIVLPHLGDQENLLMAEPGRLLKLKPWLTVEELLLWDRTALQANRSAY